METVISEFRVIETDDGFRIEIKGDKEKLRPFFTGAGAFGAWRMGRHGHGMHGPWGMPHFKHWRGPWWGWGEGPEEEEPGPETEEA